MTDKTVKREIPIHFEKINEFQSNDIRFMSVRIWILHTGLNHNNSIFEKEVVNKNLHTLANTPVLAFIEENSQGEVDFSDHRMVLERNSDGEFKFKYLGEAIGVIPESHNAHWEFRADDKGVEREYLVCDALVWTKWDEPIEIFNREGVTWQSMELSEKYTGHWNDEGNFVFDTFEFNGACLLSNVDTLPAMEHSTAELIYTRSSTDKLYAEIKEKLEIFSKLHPVEFEQKGGEMMTEEIKVEETFENETTVEVIENTEETVEVESEYVVEAFEEQQEAVVEVTEVQEEVVEEVIDYQSKFESLQVEFTSLTENFTQLEEEVKGLRQFKEDKLTAERTQQENELFARFESELAEEELNAVKEIASDFTLEQIEEKLYTLVGKKKFSFSAKKKDTETNKVPVEFSRDDEPIDPYGDLFKKFGNK